MPQFDENANMNTLMGLTANTSAPSQTTPGYTPSIPGAQEDFELISLLNPQANTQSKDNTQDINALTSQVNTLSSALQQSLQLQKDTMQRDLEWRQQQVQDSNTRRLEQIQKDNLALAQQQRENMLNGLMPQIDENSITLTPDEEKTFGTSAGFVRKIATQAQRDLLNQMAPGLRRLAEDQLTLRETVDQLKSSNANTAFTAQQQQDLIIQAQVPNAGQLVADPRFVTYKQQPSAVPGFTNGDLIDVAYRNGRSVTVIEQLRQFQNVISGKQPTVNVQGSQGQPVQTPQRTQKLRRSEYDQAVERYQMGMMDEATFHKIDAEFQTALIQGRVADL